MQNNSLYEQRGLLEENMFLYSVIDGFSKNDTLYEKYHDNNISFEYPRESYIEIENSEISKYSIHLSDTPIDKSSLKNDYLITIKVTSLTKEELDIATKVIERIQNKNVTDLIISDIAALKFNTNSRGFSITQYYIFTESNIYEISVKDRFINQDNSLVEKHLIESLTVLDK